MKYRNGFVSNSSSSSFIMGIGIVEDEDKFIQACKDSKVDVDIKTLDQFRENVGWYGHSIRNNKLVVESFSGAEVALDISNLDGNTKIAILDDVGELDGDYYFWDGDDYNYDISPTDGDYEKMSVFSEQCGIKNGSTYGGAGRNG